jgi:hypothetical protein
VDPATIDALNGTNQTFFKKTKKMTYQNPEEQSGLKYLAMLHRKREKNLKNLENWMIQNQEFNG